jgi:hypothetical protein
LYEIQCRKIDKLKSEIQTKEYSVLELLEVNKIIKKTIREEEK